MEIKFKERCEKELDLLVKTCQNQNDIDAQVSINKSIWNVLEKIDEESLMEPVYFKYALTIMSKLVSHIPLTPLTGEDDEWNTEMETVEDKEHNFEIKFQRNVRYPNLIRVDGDNKKAIDLEGIVLYNKEESLQTYATAEFYDKFPNYYVTFPYILNPKPQMIEVKSLKIDSMTEVELVV